MAPKLDIRSFFKPKPSDATKKDGGAKRPTEEAPKEEPAKKKSKFFDEKANGKAADAVEEPSRKSKTPQKAPKPKASPAANGKAAAAAKGGKSTKQDVKTTPKRSAARTKRKALVIDDDTDDDFEDEPSKPAPGAKKAAPPKGKPASAKKGGEKVEESDEDDFVYDIDDESEDESNGDSEDDSDSDIEEIVVKKGKQAAKPAARAQRAAAAAPKPSPKAVPPAQAPKAAAKPKPTPEPPSTQTPKSQAKPRARGTTSEAKSPDVQAAVAAVDAAIQKLPPVEELKYSVLAADPGAGWNQRGNEEPPNRGSKPMPRGHPECLSGKTFVITGVLDSLERPEAEDLIKRHGGRVTGSVSGKTSFLLVGMESGSSKTRQATEKGTKLIDEDGLFSLIKAAPAPERADDGFAQPSRASGAGPAPSPAVNAAHLPQTGNRGLPSSFAGRPSAPAPQVGPSRPPPAAGGQLWVERHKPQNLNELVANNAAITTLREWLESWDAIHLHGHAPPPPKGRGAKPKDYSKKAVLLSGPPGIGKTSSALIVTRALGFLPIEVNASDTRNKSDNEVGGGIKGKLANSIKELATNRAIGVGADGKAKRICLVMDEVDGMSGGDRGGVTELINTIKRSKVPIIAICNDKYNQKLKSLKNHVMELDYRKPMGNQIVPRLRAICAKEGLQVSDAALQSLAEGANGDIRLILGQLQMIRLRRTRVEYDDVRKGGGMGTTKDADMSPFEAARRLLGPESKALSIGDRMDMVYQDADLVPLLIQENYVNHRPSIARDDAQRLRLVARAADFLSLGDVVNRNVRQRQNWSLSPAAVLIGSVAPAAYMRGNRETFGLYPGEMNFPRFSAWLGQNSSSGKQRRLLGELHTRMTASGHLSADRTGLRTSYLPTLRTALTAPLVGAEKEGIEPVINIMHEYCLERDDVDFIMDVTKFKSKAAWAADPFKDIPSLVKSAFTRQVNQQKQAPRTTIMVDEFKKGRKKKGGEVDADLEGEGEEEGSAEAEGDGALAAKEGEEEQEKEEEEEDLPNPLLQAKRAKQLAKHGIVFQAKEDPKAPKARAKAAAPKKAKTSGKSAAASSGRGKR